MNNNLINLILKLYDKHINDCIRYSWCSGYLSSNKVISDSPKLSDLVTVTDKSNPKKKALLIGHNVGFDRSFMREQYFIEVEVN